MGAVINGQLFLTPPPKILFFPVRIQVWQVEMFRVRLTWEVTWEVRLARHASSICLSRNRSTLLRCVRKKRKSISSCHKDGSGDTWGEGNGG